MELSKVSHDAMKRCAIECDTRVICAERLFRIPAATEGFPSWARIAFKKIKFSRVSMLQEVES